MVDYSQIIDPERQEIFDYATLRKEHRFNSIQQPFVIQLSSLQYYLGRNVVSDFNRAFMKDDILSMQQILAIYRVYRVLFPKH